MGTMRIQDMFQKDIDRLINGVIKVAEKSDETVEQELSEYVVTHELAGHFDAFYRVYERALEAPTDEMGVWISGFFGSVSQTEPIQMAVSSGRRDVGVQLYGLLDELHPDLLDKLLKERRDDAR